MKKVLFLLFGLMLISACTTTQPAPTATPVPPTEPPPPTDTSVPPTQSPEEEIIISGEVTFDGNECRYSGPTELPTGKYSFILNDTSELNLKNFGLWIVRLEDGKTFQDLIDRQEEPGDDTQQPVWAPHPPYYSYDRVVWHYTLDKAGEHGFDVGGYPPSSVWLCTPPFQVLEASSE